MFVGEFWRKFIGCVSRHIDCTFPTCDLTTSIISLWPVDSGIKGCLWKARVSVWEQNGWPWHVMTECHLWRLAQITVTRALQPHHIAFPVECRETCFEELYNMSRTAGHYGAEWKGFSENPQRHFFEDLLDVVRMSPQYSQRSYAKL